MVVATRAENVIDIAVFMLGLSSAELTANWGQWWWWRFNGKARLTASFGGPLIFLLNKMVVFEYFIDGGSDTTYLVVLSSIGVTCALWIGVALATRPEPEEKLVEFYKRAQPMGWWGPIPEKAGIEAEGHGPIFRGLLIAAVGAVAVGSGIIGLSSAYVGRWEVAVVGFCVAVVAGAAFRGMYGGYLGGLEGEQ